MAKSTNIQYWWLSLIPRALFYKTSRAIGVPMSSPISLTINVTNRCNSRCKTCNIWKIYRGEAGLGLKESDELRLEEYEKIFRSIGKTVIWYTFSGGEPCLRKDIAEIAKLMQRYCNPKIVIVPTNGLLPTVIEARTHEMLNTFPSNTTVIVNISLDGVGDKHDEIRGVPGNFAKAIDTYKRLRELKQKYGNLELGIHSVVSKFNVDSLMDVYDFVKREVKPDSYISEIAESRNELFNMDNDIAPELSSYEKTIKDLQRRIKEDYIAKGGIASLIQSFRLNYYDFVVEALKQKKLLIPCYAGIASGQISTYGDVWPCAILAGTASMGNLREAGYDFRKVWLSRRAQEVRKSIKNGNCDCHLPTANIHYTNMLLSTRAMLKVLPKLIRKR